MGVLDDSFEEWMATLHDGDEDFPDDPTDPTDPAADQSLSPLPSDHDRRAGERSRPARDRPSRPVADIRLDLETARAYKERYGQRPASDRWVQMMRDDNEADIERLEIELASATGDNTATGDNAAGDNAATPTTAPEPGRPVTDAGPLPGPPDTDGTVDLRDPGPPRRPRRARGIPAPDLGL